MTAAPSRPVRVLIVDVRFLNEDAVFERALKRVSAFRRNKILHYRFRRDRNLSLGAGLALDVLLREYGLREKSMAYFEGPHGKPGLSHDPGICFNLSHAGDYAVCATGPSDLGIDIEPVGIYDPAVAVRCLSEKELFHMELLPEPDRGLYFTRLWTLKESLLKASGTGLTDAGSFPAFVPDRLPCTAEEHYAGFRFHEFEWTGYCASLCLSPLIGDATPEFLPVVTSCQSLLATTG